MHLLNTLYVTTPESYLRLENQTLAIERNHELKLRVPLHHLNSVVCFGPIQLSTPLMHGLAQRGIALVLLDEHGRFQARLEGPMAGNVLLRRAQHQASLDTERSLALARAFVAGKVRNARSLVLRGAREAKNDADAATLTRQAQNLAASLRALPVNASLDGVRGIEGEAARQHFAGLSLLVRPDAREHFHMRSGRSRRPPRDRLNALLSFLYSLWMNDCRSALETVGLDPQVGFLHTLRPGRAALALDLMEEFRPLAERLALTLINRQQLRASDFVERDGGAVILKHDARKAVLVAFQERKQTPCSTPCWPNPWRWGSSRLYRLGYWLGRSAKSLMRKVRQPAIYPSSSSRVAMLVIVCYDVNTEHSAGRRRLRRVAKLCEATGQRVQKSVFECQIDLAHMEALERKLLATIDPTQDCLRLYRLPETRGAEVREYGRYKAVDFEAPLVL